MFSTRDRILKLVETGQVSSHEAAQLLDALAAETSPVQQGQTRLVRVRVTDLHTSHQKVNVAIPVGLINVGLRLGARLVPHLSEAARGELLGSIARGATGRLLVWNDTEEGERIELLVE
ncbi:hypothetical protein [Candidatus Chloroploca sp. Khr17]|uniref:hypothetical protein n=1 Tax=Candidatus Chloroploca sp. Khr17 TaxID=2496869 RepID=UPI00101E20CF|nr:hypothetical protein [Candidatus Chloroploca sp. Khr17]